MTMSNEDMDQEDGFSASSQRCLEPSCASKVELHSSFCTAHQGPSPSPSSPHDPLRVNSLPRMTQFSQARVVARRGHNRLRTPWSSRASAKPTATASPLASPSTPKVYHGRVEQNYVLCSESGEEATPRTTILAREVVASNAARQELDSHSPIDSNSVEMTTYSEDDLCRRVHVEETREVSFSNPFHPVASPAMDAPPSISSSQQDNVEYTQSATISPTYRSFGFGFLSNEVTSPKDPSDIPLVAELMEVVPHPYPPGSTQEALSDVEDSDRMSTYKSPSPMDLLQSPSSQHSSDSGGAADIESNDEDEEPNISVHSTRTKFGSMDHNDTTTSLEESLESEFDSSHAPQNLTEESDNESVSMDLDPPVEQKCRDGDGDVHNADNRDSPQEGRSPMLYTVVTPSRAKCEIRRAKKLASFDSGAFDALIYQQSALQPPSGVPSPTRPPTRESGPNHKGLLALPVNPAIHGMHKRPEEWYQMKSREIEDRGGRKEWFGKVVERQRHLRSKEAAIEAEREKALRAGKIPPRKDPQPRGLKRILDFGDVPEEELPDDVRNNPAWLKACAWHREVRNQSVKRQRFVQRTTEEAQTYYRETVQKHNLSSRI